MAQNDNENSKILYRLLAACKNEQESGQLMISLDKCSERVSNYTGLPVSVIEGIIRRLQDQENVYNLDTHILLMTSIKMVLKMFIEPTFENVYESFTKNYKIYFTRDINTSAPDFFAQINSLHYELRKTKSNSYVLMENPQVTFERYHYLSKMRKHRVENKFIYFIDEKVINEKLENRKLVSEKDITAANEYVFFLMMSSNGYEHGLFTTVASDDVYKRWIENIVIPMLKPCSIIVMTNCYLHDDDKKSRITEYDTKAKMWQWLRDHDVPSSNSMSKAELWDLIRKCTDTTKTRTVDKIFQYHGYEVLHLPSTFEEISPIEFMWKKIKTDPSLTNNDNIQSAKDNLYEYLSTLQLSEWSSFLRKSFQVEEEIVNLDNDIETFFEIVCDIDLTDLKCKCKKMQSLLALLTPERNIKMED